MSPERNLWLAPVLLLIAVNMIFLDLLVFPQFRPSEPVSTEISIVNTTPTPAFQQEQSSCGKDCLAAIAKEVTKQIGSKPKVTEQVKEYYIPLGSGSIRSFEWTDIAAAQAMIDTNNYPNIKKVTFDVFMRNPTGNGMVYAKLYNVTDKHDVWFSEVSMEGHALTHKETTITLEPGNKLYRVMMKTSMGFDAILENARIIIGTN